MRSLRTKTILWALLPIALVLVIVAVITLYSYEQVMRNVVQEWETELAETLAARLSEGMNQYGWVLQTVANEDDIRSMEPARLGPALQQAGNRLAVFDAGVVAYDSYGLAVWSTTTGVDRPGTEFPLPTVVDRLRRGQRPAFSDVFEDSASGKDVVLVAVRITRTDGTFAGVLAGMSEVKYPSPGAIYAQVTELQVGESGFAYLVDGNGRVIYHPYSAFMGARLTATEPVARALNGDAGAILTEDLSGERVISGFAPISGTGWGLIIEERWDSVIGPVRGYSSLLIILLVAAGVLSVILVGLSTGRILRPIRDLTLGAQRIAGGDFDHVITAKTGDEIQLLAEQFNSMAGALNESYANLEQKVEERTRGERRRADQLRAINEVGRRISSILNLDELLPLVVHSVRETFDYYVIILLPGPRSDELAVRASSTEPGMIPVESASILKTTEGITGWVFRHGEPLLINDVSKESRFALYEGRPDTRSELAVPIKIGPDVLGVLDIESAELNAFDDIDVFTSQTLADQVAVAMENARLYQETRDMAVLEERNRMAREIHDTLAQGFTGIVLQLEAAEQALDDDVPLAQEHLNRARSLARESLNEARRSVWALRPLALEQLPIEVVLRRETESFTRDSGIKVALSIAGESRTRSPDIQSTLLRISQEALTNVRKHAGASEVYMHLAFEKNTVRLSVRDNGRGFDTDAPAESGFGLISMRERVRLLGGTLTVQSEIGRGTMIEATLPVSRR